MKDMREIKFRAWDKDRKLMSKAFTFGYVMNFADTHIMSPDHITLFPERFIAMQFTGLKDCKEMEIYEGDRVKRIKDGIEGEVYWKYDGWFVKVDGAIDARLHDWKYHCDSIEVIGNCFQLETV